MALLKLLIALVTVSGVFCLASDSNTEYYVGTGIWDVTGPAAEINMVCFSFCISYTSFLSSGFFIFLQSSII